MVYVNTFSRTRFHFYQSNMSHKKLNVQIIHVHFILNLINCFENCFVHEYYAQ